MTLQDIHGNELKGEVEALNLIRHDGSLSDNKFMCDTDKVTVIPYGDSHILIAEDTNHSKGDFYIYLGHFKPTT